MNVCIYCNRLINNKGSLIAHQLCCIKNPNKIKHKHSKNAGAKKGSVPWNKNVKFDVYKKSTELIEKKDFLHLSETAIRKHMKRFLIYKTGHMCSICKQKTWLNKPIPLVCDHIDGNSTNCNIDNFRLVCCNCDAQLPTYKSKNRGKGRSYDRQYRNNLRMVSRRLGVQT